VAGFLANFSAPASSSSSPSSVLQSSPTSVFQSSTFPTTSERLVSTEVTSSTASPILVTTTSASAQQRLVESLEEAARVFREAARPSPPVIVINQIPPAPPSPSWHQDPELPAVGAAVGFLLVVLLVAGCWWLRRYRPAKWETVKAGGVRLFTWLALPLSWVCSRSADLLRHLHASAEGQRVASDNANQVRKTVL